MLVDQARAPRGERTTQLCDKSAAKTAGYDRKFGGAGPVEVAEADDGDSHNPTLGGPEIAKKS
jgi:hypothetical protein